MTQFSRSPSTDVPQSPRRIIFYTKLPPPNTGQTLATLQAYKMLEKRGVSLAVINTSADLLRPSSNKIALVGYMFTYSAATLKLYWQMYRATRKEKYDVLYMVPSSSLPGQLKDSIALFLIGKSVPSIVGHIHSGNFGDCFKGGVRRVLGKFVGSRVSKFIFLSKGLSERVENDLPESKRVIIMNPIAEELRSSTEVAAEKIARLKGTKPMRILFLGNMIETKGYKDLLRAAPHLMGKVPFEMHFVGGWQHPNDQKAFEAEVESLGVGQYIVHHGSETDRKKVAKHFLDSHVFVLPTYYPTEAQPLSIIEAMAAGTPIVATRHASIPEYVSEGEEGYLVDKQAPEQIAEAILRFTDADNWERIARLSRRRYEDYFSPDKLHRQLCDVLGVR